MKNLYKWLIKLVLSLFKIQKKGYELISIEDAPEENNFENQKVYWVGRPDNKWCAAFICPCGCKEVIYLNLLPKGSPCWRITNEGSDFFTIHPSINRKKGCKSHFFIKNNTIIWA